MPVIWKFREDARKIVENVSYSSWGFKMLERAWDRAASLTGVSRATAQRIITKKVELLSSLIAGLLGI